MFEHSGGSPSSGQHYLPEAVRVPIRHTTAIARESRSCWDVDARQGQLARQHQPCRTSSRDHHPMLGHRHCSGRHIGRQRRGDGVGNGFAVVGLLRLVWKRTVQFAGTPKRTREPKDRGPENECD